MTTHKNKQHFFIVSLVLLPYTHVSSPVYAEKRLDLMSSLFY